MDYSDLSVGDEVVVCGGGGMRRDIVQTVARTTKTQLILNNGMKFRRDSGRQIGGSTWRCVFLKKATPDDVARIKSEQRRRYLANKLSDQKWRDMALDDLERVVAALPANHDGNNQ